MAEPELALLKARAADEANAWVIERGLLGDADGIAALADELEGAYRDIPRLGDLIVQELRLRVAYMRTMQWPG